MSHSKHQDTSVSINIDDGPTSDNVELNPKHSRSHGHDDHDHSKCNGHDHSHGPSDGHGHSHGHGHGHGGRGGHKHHGAQKWLKNRGVEIQVFVYGILVAGWAMIVFGLSDVLSHSFDSVGSHLLITFLVGMAIISYYKCTTVRNGNPSKNVPANATPQTAVTCKTCNFWKPERTHHCSACNECVLRMDHHCPWVSNCVGYRNHKSFVLFCLYLGMASVYFDYRSIYFIVSKINDDTFYDLSVIFLAGWFAMTLIICPGGLMVFGLGFYHTGLAMNNCTTLEGMGGANLRTPCDSKATTEKKMVNKYDKGMFLNLFDFFGNTYFFWWYPTVPPTIYGGQSYDQIPAPTPTEIVDFLRGKDAEESPEEKIMKPKSIAEVDVVGILKIAETFTSDKHLQFFNIMLEVGKRRDNTFIMPQIIQQQIQQALLQQASPTKVVEEKKEEEKHENVEKAEEKVEERVEEPPQEEKTEEAPVDLINDEVIEENKETKEVPAGSADVADVEVIPENETNEATEAI